MQISLRSFYTDASLRRRARPRRASPKHVLRLRLRVLGHLLDARRRHWHRQPHNRHGLCDPTLSPATPYHGAGENPFGKDFDPFPDLVDRPGPAPNPTPDDWSGAAETSRYSTNDNEPDWMRGGGGGAAHHPPPRLERQPSPEFGASTYREPTVQFDGDDGHTNTSSKDALNQSLLLNRGAGQHDNPSSRHHHRRRRRRRRRCCCGGGNTCATQILLVVTFTLSVGLFALSLMHAFRGNTNMARRTEPASLAFRTNASALPTAAAAADAVAASASCSTKTCLSPAALQKSKTCAFQFQYVDPSTKKEVCGAPTCWTSANGIPPPWKYPLSFSCPGASPGVSFFCPWDHHLTTWRAMISGAGAAASLLYLYALRSCESCVGCALGMINLLCFGHALLSFICMVQDSDAVRQANAFCAGSSIKCGASSAKVRQAPDCLMLTFTVVCLLDAALGLGWCAVGYSLCKSRSGSGGEMRDEHTQKT